MFSSSRKNRKTLLNIEQGLTIYEFRSKERNESIKKSLFINKSKIVNRCSLFLNQINRTKKLEKNKSDKKHKTTNNG